MVLCAGMGTRLGELTRETPKPLLRIRECSIVEHILFNLSKHGFNNIAVNLHFGSDQICSTLGSGEKYGVKIVYSHESTLLGTAGGVRKMNAFFASEDAFLVHYGDIVTDENFSKMLEYHQHRRALITLLVHRRSRSNSAMQLDTENRVLQFWERPEAEFWDSTPETWVNSGVLIASPEILTAIPEGKSVDWPKDIFPKVLSTGRIFAYPLTGYRMAIDSPERLERVRRDLSEEKYRPEISTPHPPTGP